MPPKAAGDVEKGEKEPLLPSGDNTARSTELPPESQRSTYRSAAGDAGWAKLRAARDVVGSAAFMDSNLDKGEYRVINYNTAELGTWSTFRHVSGTVLQSKNIWNVMFKLMLVALLVAIIVALVIPDPAHLDVSGFSTIASFLKVFVAFLLGFFMSTSVNRWKTTVSGFMILYNAVRNTQMQLLALGVELEKTRRIVRYGVLSAVFLARELEEADLPPLEKQEAVKKLLEEMAAGIHLQEEEKERLLKVEDMSSLMWTWVACYISRLAQDGDVPPMASPTYGRIISLAQEGQVGIRTVRSSIGVQVPFIYVHTLASLVHLNNILCAVALGLTLGVSAVHLLNFFGIVTPGAHHAGTAPPEKGGGHESMAAQNIAIAMLSQGIAPLAYQAFLQIALNLAHPFGHDATGTTAIPTRAFEAKLRRDCKHMEQMATDPPAWEPAHFKSAK